VIPLIAVDGPAASGKGTIARALGRHFGVPHLDTGALYRAVALSALRAGLDLTDGAAVGAKAAALDLSLLEDPELRGAATGEAASRVSALPEVRASLLAFQKAFAGQQGGAVLDGRDIGTVIAPHAPAKLFVTAAPEVRARRRYLELTSAGRDVNEAQVLADIVARDARDMGRADAPLRQAADSDLLDTSELDIAAAVRKAVELVSRRLGRIS
jgi:cytidylate kinase